MLSKMAAAAAASSTLRNVGISHLKVLSSSGIVTRKQSCISKLLHDRRSTLDLKTLSKRGTIDKAVRDSILGAAIGLGVAVVGIPAAAGVLGFSAAGITAGSIGAKMMSAAAIANGGGVASGGVVATLQSIGAAGVPTAVSAATTATGAVLGVLKNIYS